MEAQFSRLLDEWDDVTDISMVDLGSVKSQKHQSIYSIH